MFSRLPVKHTSTRYRVKKAFFPWETGFGRQAHGVVCLASPMGGLGLHQSGAMSLTR